MKNSLRLAFFQKFAIGLSFLLLTVSLFLFYSTDTKTNDKQVPPILSTTTPSTTLQKNQVESPITEPLTTLHALIEPKLVAQNKKVPPQYFDPKVAKKLENKAQSVGDRLKFEFDMLKDPATGTIPHDAAAKAAEAAFNAPVYQSLWSPQDIPGLTITVKGPTNLGGRTRALGFDRRAKNNIIAGCVSSGAYRSTNGGTSWTRVSPIGQIHNITCVAQDPRDFPVDFRDTWYYGTGESLGNTASLTGSAYRGQGIWKSTDNGNTWSQLTATNSALEVFESPFDYITRIAVDPTNGNVYAALGTQIQRSTNGGTTWETVLGSSVSTLSTDIVITSTGRLYAAFDGSSSDEGIYTSTTGASGSWTKIAGTISSVVTPATWNTAGGYGRIVLGLTPSNPNIIFALYARNFTSSCSGTAAPEAKLFKYDQSGPTWTDLSANLPDESGCSDGNDPFAVQEGYDLAIAVKPDNPDAIYIGGTNVYRSLSGFTNTSATTRIGGYNSPANYNPYNNHHPDIHILVFPLGENHHMHCGSDGGVHSGDISLTTVDWVPLNNNYITYQYYHADIVPNSASGDIVVGGAQDNGTTLSTTGTTFSSIFSGDGVAVGFISYNNSSSFNIIGGSQEGILMRLTAPNTGFTITPSGSASIFVTYFQLDQDNTNHLYYAGNNVLYRTRIASTIDATTLTGNAATGWEQMTGSISGNIRCMATSRNNVYGGADYSASNASRKLYIGTETGSVYRLNDPAFVGASTAPTDITPAGSTGLCSSISVNPVNDNEILVTYSNYGVNSVYHTTDANSATPTWTNVEGPVNSAVQLASARSSLIVKSGSTTYYLVGTSTGLYETSSLSGATTVWTRVGSTEINYALVSSMRYRVSDNKIVVGTHGNGMFILNVPGAVVPLELIAFDGKSTAEGNKLTWMTAFEKDIDGFEIQRSNTGSKNDFEIIGFVKAHNLNSRQTYDFVDTKSVTTTPQYYRLKVIERDASKSTFTKTITIEPSAKRVALDFVVAPNPVGQEMQIVFNNTPLSHFTVKVMDYSGRIVRIQSVIDFKDKSVILPVSNLASGAYLVSVESPTGSVNTRKFFKL